MNFLFFAEIFEISGRMCYNEKNATSGQPALHEDRLPLFYYLLFMDISNINRLLMNKRKGEES
jgi:hypothetical protein